MSKTGLTGNPVLTPSVTLVSEFCMASYSLTHLSPLAPTNDNSKSALPWLVKISEQMDMGWTISYSDVGTGREEHHAASAISNSRRDPTSGCRASRSLGTLATVADSERTGILLSLQAHRDDHTLLLLTDSQAAVDTCLNLCQGQPPRS